MQQSVNRLYNHDINAESEIYDKWKNPFYGLDKEDRLLMQVNAQNEEGWKECELTESCFDNKKILRGNLKCRGCNSAGSLEKEWNKENTCRPSCKKDSLSIESEWMT